LAEVTTSFKLLEKKFDKLLSIFEKAANFISGKTGIKGKESKERIKPEREAEPSDLARKLDLLVEQNKAMAEGLLLLEKFIKERIKPESLTESESEI
jgi:rhamnose utilization protein RhaD (predicted bifunctional aldolase and dehydrogenase)